MSTYTLTTAKDTLVHRATADTDCTILIVDGAAIALVEDANDEVCGYYHEIVEGEYVHNMHDGFSWYVQDGELCSMHGEPDGMDQVGINDGSQDLAGYDSDIAELIGAERDLDGLVVVETMPEWLRSSHAAGNSGLYPHNGATRFWIDASTAEEMVEGDGEWTHIVEDADPTEYTIRR